MYTTPEAFSMDDIPLGWVKSAGSREDVPLFTTMDELNNAEKDIQKYFRNLASFEDIEIICPVDFTFCS